MVKDEDLVLVQVELGLRDLGRWWLLGVVVKFKLLSHLLDEHVLAIVVFFELETVVNRLFWVVDDTAVDQLVRPILVKLIGLVLLLLIGLIRILPANDLVAVDQPILVTVMIVPKLAVVAINLDQLLPVLRLLRIVMLNQFELVREPTAHSQLVDTACVLRADLIDDQSVVVLVQGDSAHETVYLLAL